jgi:hypothetical protein
MTSAPTEIPPWSGRRWIAFSVIVFVVQLALIFWLSDRRPAEVRSANPSPDLRFAGEDSADLLALLDPTLFALPNPRSFSGKAWLQAPPILFRPLDWSEPAAWLPLQTHQLGAVFQRLIRTNTFGAPQLPEMPIPQSFPPDIAVTPLARDQSELQVAGGLTGRRLINPVTLGPWPHTDMLTNTVVQLVVDTLGVPRSATLLVSSGLKSADSAAIEAAHGMRFEPLPEVDSSAGRDPLNQLQWGQLVFAWQTVPMPATNSASGSP